MIRSIGIKGNPNGSNVTLYDFAAFKNKIEFEETNKWFHPKFTSMMKELDGILENIPGQTIIEYKRT